MIKRLLSLVGGLCLVTLTIVICWKAPALAIIAAMAMGVGFIVPALGVFLIIYTFTGKFFLDD